jgi:hypothetical protein
MTGQTLSGVVLEAGGVAEIQHCGNLAAGTCFFAALENELIEQGEDDQRLDEEDCLHGSFGGLAVGINSA